MIVNLDICNSVNKNVLTEIKRIHTKVVFITENVYTQKDIVPLDVWDTKNFLFHKKFFEKYLLATRNTQQLMATAYVDYLTGLNNRKYLFDIYQKKLPDNYCVLFLDLDGFKLVNDVYGHDIGDKALRVTAECLAEITTNGIAIRNGGDEFIVIKNGIYQKEESECFVYMYCDALKTAFSKFPEFQNLSASCGFALSIPGHSLEDTIRVADKFMYRHKRSRACSCVRV